MPLFMFVSGFLNNKPEKVVTIKQHLLTTSKKALTLLVPSISYLLIVSMRDERNIGEAFLFFYLNPQNYLWFLWVLFVIHLVFDFGLYISNKIRSKISFLAPVIFSGMLSIIIVLLMFIIKGKFDFSVLALKLIAYYIPFYCLGYLIHIFVNSDFSQKKHAQNLFCIIAGISFIVVVFISFYFKSIYSFDDSNIRYVLIRVVGSIASILFCTFIADKVIKFVFFAKVSRYGTYSLQSYYLHVIFLGILNFSAESTLHQWLLSFGAAGLMIIMVAITMIILYFIPYSHLILFGKSFSYYKFEEKLPKILR